MKTDICKTISLVAAALYMINSTVANREDEEPLTADNIRSIINVQDMAGKWANMTNAERMFIDANAASVAREYKSACFVMFRIRDFAFALRGGYQASIEQMGEKLFNAVADYRNRIGRWLYTPKLA